MILGDLVVASHLADVGEAREGQPRDHGFSGRAHVGLTTRDAGGRLRTPPSPGAQDAPRGAPFTSAASPGKRARVPSASSILSSRLYFAIRSLRHPEP